MEDKEHSEVFFKNLAECAKNLILGEQGVILKELSEALKDEETGVKVAVVMKVMGPRLTCKPYIETVRSVKRKNEAELVDSDSTPDMFEDA